MVIDDKGGEVMHKDSEKMTLGEKYESKGINLKFEHTSRGSKLMDLVDAFECAFTYACLHLRSLNSLYMLVWCMLVVNLNDEMRN